MKFIINVYAVGTLESSEHDLHMASQCAHNIGSNSSYSWWIHYLNTNPRKIGIFPEKWFGPAYGNVDTSDLDLPGIIKL